jgi:hypothetical protein
MDIGQAFDMVFDLRCEVATFFTVSEESVKMSADEPGSFCLTVTVLPSKIENLSSKDFERFCNSRNLSGVIFFDSMNTITFSMCPKKKIDSPV